MAPGTTTRTNVTTVNLASSNGKKAQSAVEILKQIESTLPDTSQQQLAHQRQGGLSAHLQGRINEHELTYGDKALPRQRLPKVDNVLLDRYQAARQNVLVLGAIQQAEQAKTHRSGKGGSHTPHTAGRPVSTLLPPASSSSTAGAAAAGGGGTGTLSAAGSVGDPLCLDESLAGGGLDSTFNSFKSRASSSKALGSIREQDALSAQASGMNLNPESSYISSTKGGRRYARQGSNSSVASRFSAASFASGLTGASAVSSSGQGGRLRQQHSYVSSGGSSSRHTQRSYKQGSTAGSSWGGGHRKGAKRKPAKRQPGRISRAFAEFSKDDWVSRTLLKHTMASIIQAHWRGYNVRQRWKINREQLVMDEQERLQADSTQQARLHELQIKLQLYQQKKLAQAAAEAVAVASCPGDPDAAAAGSSSSSAAVLNSRAAEPVAGHCTSSAVSRAASAAWHRGELALGHASAMQSMHSLGDPSSYATDRGYNSDSDSGWSDVELEDVAAIKFRATTPPWQRGAERQQMSVQLRQRMAAAAAAATGEPFEPAADWADGLSGLVGFGWDSSSDDNTAKLQELRHRRICRKPEPVPVAAVAAAASEDGAAAGATEGAGGPGHDDGDDDNDDAQRLAAAAALPQDVVEALLLQRYNSKYSRLGVPHKMPGRARWLKMQAAAVAAATAAAAAAKTAACEEDGGQDDDGAVGPGAALPGGPGGAAATTTAAETAPQADMPRGTAAAVTVS